MEIGPLLSTCQISLQARCAARLATSVEDATAEMRDLADRRSDVIIDDDQVIVGVERQLVGIKAALGLRRCAGQFIGELAAHREDRCRSGNSTQEEASRYMRKRGDHGWDSQRKGARLRRNAAPLGVVETGAGQKPSTRAALFGTWP